MRQVLSVNAGKRRAVALGGALLLWVGGTVVASAAAGDPCFDWPLGGIQSGSFVPGWNTRVMQNYNNRGGATWYTNRAHTGVDLSLNSGATAGAAVVAAANGVVQCVVNATYPGWVTVIRHTMGDGSFRYTQYGHTNQPWVTDGTPVTKGQQFATVLDQAGNSHLHFEVRDWAYYLGNTANCYGPGYAPGTTHPDVGGWRNPVDWHFTHLAAFPGQGVTDIVQNVRHAPSLSTGVVISQLTSGVRYPVSQILPDANGGKEWWYSIQYATNTWGWAAGYQNTGWGGEVYVVEPVRTCGGGSPTPTPPVPTPTPTPAPGGPFCTANCGGGGWWCAGNGSCISNGVPGHNYHCPGNNMPPDRDQACALGCVFAPTSFPDYCRPGSFCGGGAWCGNDCVNGYPSTLYNFTAGGVVSSVRQCSVGFPNQRCVIAPPGSPDFCN